MDPPRHEKSANASELLVFPLCVLNKTTTRSQMPQSLREDGRRRQSRAYTDENGNPGRFSFRDSAGGGRSAALALSRSLSLALSLTPSGCVQVRDDESHLICPLIRSSRKESASFLILDIFIAPVCLCVHVHSPP